MAQRAPRSSVLHRPRWRWWLAPAASVAVFTSGPTPAAAMKRLEEFASVGSDPPNALLASMEHDPRIADSAGMEPHPRFDAGPRPELAATAALLSAANASRAVHTGTSVTASVLDAASNVSVVRFCAGLEEIGCMVDCQCRAWKQCYPKHMAARGDVGQCQLSVLALTAMSVAAIFATLMLVALARYILLRPRPMHNPDL
mmetsp:Transcript_96789/g.278467  ORF Transcript_96789/g.278467 Transcript_96789/m.278467 type:complete len:200 (-) Transcript_96789:355-954(-)